MFINPYHADLLDLIAERGYGDKFAAWKVEITKLARAYDVQLWDFATAHVYAGPSSADIPAEPVSDWFWEPSHYKQRPGEFLIVHLSGRCPDTHIAKDLGALLNVRRPDPGAATGR